MLGTVVTIKWTEIINLKIKDTSRQIIHLHSFNQLYFENMLSRRISLTQGYINGSIQIYGYLIDGFIEGFKIFLIVGYIEIGKHTMHVHASFLTMGIGTKNAYYWHLLIDTYRLKTFIATKFQHWS